MEKTFLIINGTEATAIKALHKEHAESKAMIIVKFKPNPNFSVYEITNADNLLTHLEIIL